MGDGLADLSAFLTKYTPGSGRQKITLDDLYDLILGLLQGHELSGKPSLVFVDATAIRCEATADSPARVMMCGYPNIVNPRQWITGGLTDGLYRENTGNATFDYDTASTFWGNEKASNWRAIFAVAGDADATFTLKAMPYCRVKSQATKTISLGTHLTPATGIGYGWDTDSLAGYKLYFLSGASRGLLVTVVSNNNDDSTGGTITYSESALSVAEGDWFIILPSDTNFRWLGDCFNNSSSNLTEVDDIFFGKERYPFLTAGTFYWLCPFTWISALVDGCAAGGGGGPTGAGFGGGGGGGSTKKDYPVTLVGGTYYTITIAASAAADTNGGVTSLGAVLSLSGGSKGTSTAGGAAGGDGGAQGEPPSSDTGGTGGSTIFGPGGPGGYGPTQAAVGGKFGAGGGGDANNGGGKASGQGFLDIKKSLLT